MGGLNVVVNCAGIGTAGRILGRNGPMPMEQFTRTIQVNLVGTFMCDRAAAVIMQHNAPGARRRARRADPYLFSRRL